MANTFPCTGWRLWLVAVAALAGAGAAQAQPNTGSAPWCVVMSDQGGWLDCAYHSLAQCMRAASGVSNVCTANAWSMPEPPGRRSGPRPARPRW